MRLDANKGGGGLNHITNGLYLPRDADIDNTRS